MGTTLDLTSFTLTYDDEFNTFTASPDGSAGYQTTFYNGSRALYSNGDIEIYSDSSVGVNPFALNGGALQITAAPSTDPNNQTYTSGLITTEGNFAQTYGYFEARVEVAQGAGMWSGFWMLPANESWPPEIDIMEAFGAPNPKGDGGAGAVWHAVQVPDPNGYLSTGGWEPTGGNIYDSYHTYGVDWEPDFITYYMDGTELAQVVTPPGLDTPMYMLLNLAVGGPWAWYPNGETSALSIDYIRAYSENPNAAAVALQAVSSPDGVDTIPYGVTAAGGIIGGDNTVIANTGSDRIVVRVAEQALNGDAQFTVSVDGQQLGDVQTVTASHAAGQWQDITLATTLLPGNHAIAVNYINGTTAATDPVLYVQSVTVNGEVIAGTTAQNTDANGLTDPNAAVLDINGTATFNATYSTLSVRVSEDAWNGNAQFVVLVDGLQIGGTQTATASHAAGLWQDISLGGYFDTGAHTVAVSFINDGWGGSAGLDRNMYIQSITMNGETLEGPSAQNNASYGQSGSDQTAAVMAINGTATFSVGAVADSGTGGTGDTGGTTSGQLTLHVSEDAYNGNAQFTVTVDGAQFGGVQTVTASHALHNWQDISIAGDLSAGPHTIGVNFINDAWGGSAALDRNMYVQSITVNGETLQGPSAQDNAAYGQSALDATAAVMATNGTATFQSFGSGTAQPSTLVLNVSEDAWNGNAQFTVSIDGTQVGGIQTATASHALGQVQAITLTGDFGILGPNTVDISFINDGWGGTAATDRNLYVQSIDINGVHFAGNLAADNAAGGQEALDAHAAVMAINGVAEFNIHYQAPPEFIG